MFFEKKQDFDVREIRRTFWRRRSVIAIPAILTVAASALGVFLTEPTYESIATLAVETPAPLTRTVQQATGTRGRGASYAIQTIRKKIQSTSFLESVAIQVGLHESPRLIERANQLAAENPSHDRDDLLRRECVTALARMLEIHAEGADIFSVRTVSSSAQVAYRVAEAVAEQYIQSSRQSRLRQSEEAFKFAHEQMAIYELKLEEKRRLLREYEQEIALRPLSSSPVSAENINRVNTLIAAAEADLGFVRNRLAVVRGRVAQSNLEPFLTTSALSSPKLTALTETVYELERHLAMTLMEYEEADPAALAARSQIAVKSQQLLSELEGIAANAFPSLASDQRQALVDFAYTSVTVEAATRRRQELRSFLDRYAADLESMPAEEFRLARLREEVNSSDRLYQTWLEQANSTQIAKAVESASVGNLIALIEPATLPLAPFAPEKGKILMLASVMGIVLGFGMAIFMEYLDLTLKSVEEIEMVLQAPILGAVPRMQSAVIEDMEQRRRRRLRVLVPSMIATILALASIAYWYFVVQGNGVG